MTNKKEAVQDAVYLLEDAQDQFGEYDHAQVDDVLALLREVADE